MAVQILLFETLEGILVEEFKKFKFYLKNEEVAGYRKIPPSRLETASRDETVTYMTQAYGEELAVNITIKILRKMLINDAAERLKKKYAEGLNPDSSTSTAARPPPTPPSSTTSVSAQQGAYVIAPVLHSSNPGTLNITINTPK